MEERKNCENPAKVLIYWISSALHKLPTSYNCERGITERILTYSQTPLSPLRQSRLGRPEPFTDRPKTRFIRYAGRRPLFKRAQIEVPEDNSSHADSDGDDPGEELGTTREIIDLDRIPEIAKKFSLNNVNFKLLKTDENKTREEKIRARRLRLCAAADILKTKGIRFVTLYVRQTKFKSGSFSNLLI